jgi:hypothetical protein
MGDNSRLLREAKTIKAMIDIYCRGQGHAPRPPCEACASLLDYSLQRVEKCRFGPDKPACAKCPIHCYKPDMRERVSALASG